MITVIEKWCLLPEFEGQGVEIMQRMDDIIGPAAHSHPGFAGHAQFYKSHFTPGEFLVVYPWRSLEDHRDLTASEEPLLAEFFAHYCIAKRQIFYYDEVNHYHVS